MRLVTVGPVEGGLDAFERSLGEAADTLESLRLAVLWLPYDADWARWLEVASRMLSCPVVGGTTGAAAFTERGWSADAAVAGLFGGDDLTVSLAVARDVSRAESPAAVLGQAIRNVRLESGAHQVVLTLADPYAVDGEQLVKLLRENTPRACQHLGGLVGDGLTFSHPRVFVGTEVLEDAVVFVGMSTREQRLYGGVRHGFRPLTGRVLTVTRSQGNVVYELDGRAALLVCLDELIRGSVVTQAQAAAWRKEIAAYGTLRDPAELLPLLAGNTLGMQTLFGDELKIRSALALLDDGAIQYAATLAVGSTGMLVASTDDELLEAAQELMEHRASPGAPAAVARLVFDCAGRFMLLGERYGEQVSTFLGDRGVPTLGMASYGEIARLTGRLEGFHNNTAVLGEWR